MCLRFEPSGFVVVRLIDRPLLGESTPPFIDERDSLTSERERERVRTLLNLVAHAVGYKMMVGAHNTIHARRMWEVLPHSPCMANDGAHNTIDAQRHVGVLPCSPGMGIDGAHNTVGQNVGAHNTAWILTCLEGCRVPFWHVLLVLSCRCSGYGPWYCG